MDLDQKDQSFDQILQNGPNINPNRIGLAVFQEKFIQERKQKVIDIQKSVTLHSKQMTIGLSQQRCNSWVQILSCIVQCDFLSLKIITYKYSHSEQFGFFKNIQHILFHSLTFLNLNKGKINTIQALGFMSMPFLQRIKLDNNEITATKPLQKANFKFLEQVSIHNNPICHFETSRIKFIQTKRQNYQLNGILEYNIDVKYGNDISFLSKIQSPQFQEDIEDNFTAISQFFSYLKPIKSQPQIKSLLAKYKGHKMSFKVLKQCFKAAGRLINIRQRYHHVSLKILLFFDYSKEFLCLCQYLFDLNLFQKLWNLKNNRKYNALQEVQRNHAEIILENQSSKMISFVLKKEGAIGELYLAQIGSPFATNCSFKSSVLASESSLLYNFQDHPPTYLSAKTLLSGRVLRTTLGSFGLGRVFIVHPLGMQN